MRFTGTPTLAGQHLFTVEAWDHTEHLDYGPGEVVSRGFVITIQP